jgi:hypothetical protein
MERARAEIDAAEGRLHEIEQGVLTLQRKERSIVEYVQMLNRQKHQLERELLQRGGPSEG